MTEEYLWRVYVIGPPGRYETVVSSTEPTVAPSDGSPIDPTETIILDALFLNLTEPGYININSQLADNQAVKIRASDTNGGIDIDAGLGGITMDSTNTISLDAGAESNFTTSNGNLIFRATVGLVNIDSAAGINIGNDPMTTYVLLGTADNLKHVLLGSTNTTSSTTINSGTGGIVIGNNSNGGEIHIATNTNNKTIQIGNSSTFTRMFHRNGVGGGLIKSQDSAIFVFGDQNTNILISHLLAGILSGTPTISSNRLLNLPTANAAVGGIPGIQVNDCIDFSVINKGDGLYTIVPDTGGIIDGNATVLSQTSGLFRLRFTNVTATTEAYIIYRIA